MLLFNSSLNSDTSYLVVPFPWLIHMRPILFLLAFATYSSAYAPPSYVGGRGAVIGRSGSPWGRGEAATLTGLQAKAKRGRLSKSLREVNEGGSQGSSTVPSGFSSSPESAGKNWVPIPNLKVNSLPDEDGITLIDTNLKPLINGATNPTGALCVARYEGKLYCFQVNCECCKVPMNKAKLLPPTSESGGPRVSCDFCSSTYSLKTGLPLEDARKDEGAGGNVFGSMIKNLMSSQSKKALQVYSLSADNKDRVLIDI